MACPPCHDPTAPRDVVRSARTFYTASTILTRLLDATVEISATSARAVARTPFALLPAPFATAAPPSITRAIRGSDSVERQKEEAMAKKGLVVGISGYGFPNDLPNCTRDAEAFGSMLESLYRFDHVRVLKDGEASRDGVDRALDWLVQDAGPNDRLVFFFSGHGCRFEKNGAIGEALVLHDGRLLDDQHLAQRMEPLPPGIFTAVLDCCFSGLDEILVHPSGEVEIARTKRWIPADADRRSSERLVTPGAKAFTPFGQVKPAPLEAMAAQLRSGPSFDPSPARLVALAEPQAKALFVMPCLADETTVAGTSQTGALSPFTQCLLNEVRRRGPNRSAFEILHATGQALRRLGFRQTPLVKEPLQPEHLALRAFLTFQPVLAVYPPQGPGREGDDDLSRSIAEAVRSALTNIQEGRSMHATIPGGQTFLGDDIGTIVNTVTPIVASVLHGRGSQPYGGYQPWAGGYSPMGFGAQGFGAQGFGAQGFQGSQSPYGWWQGGVGQRGQFEEVAQLVGAIVPVVLAGLQSRFHQPYQPGFQFQSPMGAGLQPYDIAQIVSTVTPIVTSLLQSRGYQGHFGQFMPRAA
jgi:hypothetical protein